MAKSALKGVEVIDSVEIDSFDAWLDCVEGGLAEKDLIESLKPAGETATPGKDSRSYYFIGTCLTPEWRSQLKSRLEDANQPLTGRALWALLKSDHAAHKKACAPRYSTKFENLLPEPNESVAKFVDKFVEAAHMLKSVGRARSLPDLQDSLLQKLELARPAWAGVLLAVRGNINDETTLAQLKSTLQTLEIRTPSLAPSEEDDGASLHALAAQGPSGRAPRQPAPSVDVAALLEGFNAMQVQINALVAQGSGKYQQPGPIVCHNCGETGHKQRDFRTRRWTCPWQEGQSPRDSPRPVRTPAIQHPTQPGTPPPPWCMSATLGDLVDDWIVDSGTTAHMSPGGGGVTFTHYQTFDVQQPVRFGKKGSTAYAIGMGDIALFGTAGGVLLTDVLHVPDLAGNLFSVKCATRLGHAVHFTPESQGSRLFILRDDGSTLCTGALRGCGMYTLDMGHHACAAHANTNALELAQLWHRRLGHVAFGTLADMARKGFLGDCEVTPAEFLQARDHAVCEPCVLGKLPRNPHPQRHVPRPVRLLHRVHSDVLSFDVPTAGHGGARYALCLVDESSHYARVKLLCHKSDVRTQLPRLIAWFETQTDLHVQRLRCDRGGEFIDGGLQGLLADKGVQVELTATNAHQSNGVAERFNRTLLDRIRSMLADSGLSRKYWGDAALYACDQLNSLLGRGSSVVPHEALLRRRPDLSQFRIFGCRAWVHAPDKPGRKKLDARASRGRFLGFEQPMGSGVYRVLLDNGRITNSRTVVFSEPASPTPSVPAAPPPASPLAADNDDDEEDEPHPQQPDAALPAPAPPQPDVHLAPEPQPAPLPPQPDLQPAPQPQEQVPLQEIAAAEPPPARAKRSNAGVPPERWVSYGFTALTQQRLSVAAAAPLPTIPEEPPTRRRHRRRRRSQKAPAPVIPTKWVRSPRGGGSCRGVIERLREPAAEADTQWHGMRPPMAYRAQQQLTYESAPRTVAEALSRHDAALWQQAIDEELASCLKHEVWEECDLPPGKQALPSRFIFERKRNGRHKARLVAGGHRQQHGLDFDETYAPTCAYRTMRMIMAVAAKEDLEMRQFDIKTAFLNGELEEEVYMRPPVGVDVSRRGRMLRLYRALYGLRQAGRAWNKRLESELRAKGFVQSDSDAGLWILHGEAGAVLAMFYVDDGLVAARTAEQADALVAIVASIFEIRELGEPEDLLGIRITRDRQARTITIHQADKIHALAAAAGVEGESRPVPMSPEVFAGLRAAGEGEPLADRDQYRSQLGTVLHLTQCTRPDVSLPTHALAAYAQAPSQAHHEALLNLIRYLGSTATRGITYGGTQVPVKTWCDANFASCLDTRRSITGWVVTMYGGAVSWSSKKQPTTAVSTMEAEYQACGAVAREGISLLKAFEEIGLLSEDLPFQGPLTIFCDNEAALTLCKDRKEGQRVKHIDIIHHFARDRVASGELQFVYCKSADNVSDCFTKALPKVAFEVCLRGLGMIE